MVEVEACKRQISSNSCTVSLWKRLSMWQIDTQLFGSPFIWLTYTFEASYSTLMTWWAKDQMSTSQNSRHSWCQTARRKFMKIIYRSGCMEIQINDRKKDFINKLNNSLHSMTGTMQLITSSYLPQFNGWCERQNRMVKNSLVKIPDDWPYIIKEMLYAHMDIKLTSINYSSFLPLYDRESTLPVDMIFDLVDFKAKQCEELFF